ncbi:MAG: NYN domain-containing protein [Paracoccaceae bacterium]
MADGQNGEARRQLLAVLIDGDNIKPTDAGDIFDEIAGLGEAAVRRVYGDFSSPNMNGWNRVFGKHALVAHQQHANTKGKNASDIALVIDAMDLMHTGRFDGFVLVSSDSDFTRLASRIREQGLVVFGIGERKTPASFREACNQFIYIENIVAPATPAEQAAAPEASNTPKPEQPKPEGESNPPEARAVLPPSKAVPIIRKAMAGSDVVEWMPLSALGSKIRAVRSDFDPRDYGHTKLVDVVRSSGHFDVEMQGNTARVRIKPAQAPKKKPASGPAKG